MKTAIDLIEEVLTNGGAIITSDACHPAEIAIARARGEFAQHGDFGLVMKSRRWVEKAQAAQKSHETPLPKLRPLL